MKPSRPERAGRDMLSQTQMNDLLRESLRALNFDLARHY